jgi:hypothetical protein
MDSAPRSQMLRQKPVLCPAGVRRNNAVWLCLLGERHLHWRFPYVHCRQRPLNVNSHPVRRNSTAFIWDDIGGERKTHDEIGNSDLSANLKIFLFPSMCPYFHLFHILLYLTLHRTYGSLDCMQRDIYGVNARKHSACVFGLTHDQNLRWFFSSLDIFLGCLMFQHRSW